MPLQFQKWNVTSIMSCLNSDNSFQLAMNSQAGVHTNLPDVWAFL